MYTILRPLLLLLLAVSGAGFALSVAAHIAALAGIVLVPDQRIFLLHVGIFVVWFPAVLISMRAARGAYQRQFWNILLSGCPDWMRKLFYGLFAYAFVNFFLGLASNPEQHGTEVTAGTVRLFSGHWMVFYYTAFAIFLSILRKPELLEDRRCPNGHPVSALDKFCPECGTAV